MCGWERRPLYCSLFILIQNVSWIVICHQPDFRRQRPMVRGTLSEAEPAKNLVFEDAALARGTCNLCMHAHLLVLQDLTST